MDPALGWTRVRSNSLPGAAVILAVLAVTAVYQFLPVVHFFAPLQLFGKNIYTVMPAVIMIGAFVLLLPGIWRTPVTPVQAWGFLALAFIWVIVITARSAVYAETPDVLRGRYLLLLFIFSAVLRYVADDPAARTRLTVLLIGAICAQAILGILHTHFLPELELVPDTAGELEVSVGVEEGGSGESGTLISRSTFGDLLVCGQFVLLVERRIPFVLRAAIMGLLFYGVSISLARYAQGWSAFLVAALFINRRMDRAAPLVLAGIVMLTMAMALTGWTPFELQSNVRLDEDSGGRGEKLGLLINTLSNYWPLSALLGIPNSAALAAVTDTGVVISDDSYGEITMDFGFVGLLLFVTCLFAWLVRWPMSILSALMLIFLLGNFALTNSVLWDVWLFYFLAAWWLVHTGTRKFALATPSSHSTAKAHP
jgi:hypothetical protein